MPFVCQQADSRWSTVFAPIAVALLVLAGCGGEEEPPLEFDFVSDRPQMAEVEFGQFVVPVPGQTLDAANQPHARNYLQLQFVLFGVVDPSDASEAERLAERRRGELRDRVIKVCRNTSIGELKDPDLLTLKLRMIDATQPVFEGITFDSLLIRDLMIDAL